MSLVRRVLDTIQRHAMVPRGGRVLVALSGGPDSVGLLHILLELQAAGVLVVAGTAHLNHQIRPAAAEDERFCHGLADRLGVPVVVQAANVRALAREWRTSLEDAGRRARYAFLSRAAAELQAPTVATGHTRDDQAETFLLQLIRGAGATGLASIRPTAPGICRPLLDVGRAELRAWLDERGLQFRDDESNIDPAYARNRVRHELIPLLASRFSPGIVGVLAREAALLRADAQYLDERAIEVAGSVVLVREAGEGARDGGRIELDAEALRSLPEALRSRVALRALGEMSGGRFVGFDHVSRLLTLIGGCDGHGVSLPGQFARRRGNRIVLSRAPGAFFANSFRIPLSIPGEVLLERQGWAVTGSDLECQSVGNRIPPQRLTVEVQGVALPLAVRSRRRGDRFRPAGGPRKKLQDFFVDRKVPREARDLVPLVVDGDDRIVWVVGESLAEDFRVTDPSRGVLLLQARRLGGLG